MKKFNIKNINIKNINIKKLISVSAIALVFLGVGIGGGIGIGMSLNKTKGIGDGIVNEKTDPSKLGATLSTAKNPDAFSSLDKYFNNFDNNFHADIVNALQQGALNPSLNFNVLTPRFCYTTFTATYSYKADIKNHIVNFLSINDEINFFAKNNDNYIGHVSFNIQVVNFKIIGGFTPGNIRGDVGAGSLTAVSHFGNNLLAVNQDEDNIVTGNWICFAPAYPVYGTDWKENVSSIKMQGAVVDSTRPDIVGDSFTDYDVMNGYRLTNFGEIGMDVGDIDTQIDNNLFKSRDCGFYLDSYVLKNVGNIKPIALQMPAYSPSNKLQLQNVWKNNGKFDSDLTNIDNLIDHNFFAETTSECYMDSAPSTATMIEPDKDVQNTAYSLECLPSDLKNIKTNKQSVPFYQACCQARIQENPTYQDGVYDLWIDTLPCFSVESQGNLYGTVVAYRESANINE